MHTTSSHPPFSFACVVFLRSDRDNIVSASLLLDIISLLRNLPDRYVYYFSLLFSFFYMFQYVKLPYIIIIIKMASGTNNISHFSTIILNKNTHKIIILGIYIFGENSKILLKFQKKPFSLRSVPGTLIKYAKEMKKFDREV